jgi:hypothetical protein
MTYQQARPVWEGGLDRCTCGESQAEGESMKLSGVEGGGRVEVDLE